VTHKVVHPIPPPPFPVQTGLLADRFETAKPAPGLHAAVYPYRNRFRWFLFGRYSHLIRACRDNGRAAQDKVLRARLGSMRAWNSIRFGVSLLLATGIVATVVSAYVNAIPGANAVVGSIVGASTAASAALSLIYFLLTRLLGQLEIDVLMILTLDQPE